MAATTSAVWRAWWALYLTHITQAVQVTMPFVASVYMVRGFLLAEQQQQQQPPGAADPGTLPAAVDEQRVARLTGLLTAAFSAAQLLTSWPLGVLSDRVGRRPIMVLGNIAGAATVLWYGLAGSYGGALAARTLGGLCNAVIGAEKAMIGEGVERQDQATAFGLFSLMWGAGALAGPLLGGWLSQPCDGPLRIERLCQPGSLLAQRPFILPCVITALLSLGATAACIAALPETLPRLRARGASSGAGSDVAYSKLPAAEGTSAAADAKTEDGGVVEMAALQASPRGQPQPEQERRRAAEAATADLEQGGALLSKLQALERRQRALRGDIADSASEGGGPAQDDPPGSQGEASTGTAGAAGDNGSMQQQQQQQQQTDGSLQPPELLAAEWGSLHHRHHHPQQHDSQGGGGTDDKRLLLRDESLRHEAVRQLRAAAMEAGPTPWWRQGAVLMSLVGYGLVAFLFSFLDELVPIFASAAMREGGLGLTTVQLAPPLAFSGVVLMVWSLAGFPWLVRAVGNIRATRIGLWNTLPVLLALPAVRWVAGSAVATQLVLFAVLGMRSVAATNAFTGCLILVNSAAPKAALGSVNGAGQTVASLVRAAAPALGGLSWAWALQLAGGTEFQQFLPFTAAALVALVADMVYWQLKLPPEEVSVSAGPGPAAGSTQGGE